MKKIVFLCRLPNFFNAIDINEDICIIQMKHEEVVLDKPIYAGSAILDLSKMLMYNFHYDFAYQNFVKNGKNQSCSSWTPTVLFTIFQ